MRRMLQVGCREGKYPQAHNDVASSGGARWGGAGIVVSVPCVPFRRVRCRQHDVFVLLEYITLLCTQTEVTIFESLQMAWQMQVGADVVPCMR